jgi:hypothetical protein
MGVTRHRVNQPIFILAYLCKAPVIYMLIDRWSSNPAEFYTTVYHLRRLLTDYLEDFMKIKLTESAVEKASCPKGQQALLWDTETKGSASWCPAPATPNPLSSAAL